ncbi:MAG: adenylate/guanylate cyclase domain-containing protein [Dehalococcoidia bacterium]|nr:adenylate/guanylate cyclase domain-containing protein [Dehalococcoidia bacterium]
MAVKCPKCQADNREGAKFCEQCAAPLARKCLNCGADVGPKARFCDQCAHDLEEPKTAPPVDYSKPQSYTPKFLAEKILSTGKSMEGERKLVTVLFADVANYTAMSEKLDPEEVHQIMEGCFQILMDEIHRYEGTIDKFTGDGVMALFGAPLAHEDHAQRACYAALAIQKALESYGQKVEKDCKLPFRMRVGLNSGPVIVGSVGKDLKMDYTAVGDTVNLASRMQSLAEPGRILVSADVYKMARDFFNFKARGKKEVKGKEEAVEAYELLEPTEVASRIEAAALRGLTRFVGREKEMATLREAFDKAKSGSGQVVCIVGEAGVGKSRLLLELRRSIPQDEYTYLEGRCLHYGSSMPYLPLLDILRSYFGLKEGEREFLVRKRLEEKTSAIDPKLKAILPPLQELLSLKVEDEAYLKLEPQKKREKIFEAIRDLLVVESQRKPLMVAIDDFQWTDRTSEEFLSYFIGHLPSSRILLLLLYRPEYTHQWASKSCYSQIRVDELPTKSSADLVRAMLEEGEVAPELRELILNRAAGNPLFMEEFTHTLLENGSIQKKDHQYVLSRKPSEIHVPDTIQGIIAARMDRLDENLKRIMQVASVIGRDFAYRILQTITGMQEELKGHLVNLQGLEFIYEKSLYPELEYVFKHALTQEVAYNSLLLKRRKQIHERIGKAIEELYPDRLEEFCEPLALHYKQGECFHKAVEYLIKAGEKSLNRYAVEEAHQHFRDAFDILSRKAVRTREEDRLLIDMLIKWAYVHYFRGSFEELHGLLRAHDELAQSLDDQERLGMFRNWRGFVLYSIGEVKEAHRYLHEVLNLGEGLGSQKVVGYACSWLAWTCGYLGLLDEAITHGERALAISSSFEEDQYLYYKTVGALSYAYYVRGDKKQTLETAEALLEYGRSHGSIRSLVLGHVGVGLNHLMSGDYVSAVDCMRQGTTVAADPFYEQYARMWLGVAQMFNGQFEQGGEALQRALAYSREVGAGIMEDPVQLALSLAEVGKGQVENALRQCEEAAERFLVKGMRSGVLTSYLWVGRLYALFQGSVTRGEQKALDCTNRAIGLAREIGAKGLLGEAYLDLGRFYQVKSQNDQAREYFAWAAELFEQCGLEQYLKQAREALHSLR